MIDAAARAYDTGCSGNMKPVDGCLRGAGVITTGAFTLRQNGPPLASL